MSTCAAERYITTLALEKARGLRADLARLGDDEARATLAAEVVAGRAKPSRDVRTGDPQEVVELGPAGAPWGFAVVKAGGVVVTIVDEPRARYLRTASREPVAPRTCPKCGAAC